MIGAPRPVTSALFQNRWSVLTTLILRSDPYELLLIAQELCTPSCAALHPRPEHRCSTDLPPILTDVRAIVLFHARPLDTRLPTNFGGPLLQPDSLEFQTLRPDPAHNSTRWHALGQPPPVKHASASPNPALPITPVPITDTVESAGRTDPRHVLEPHVEFIQPGHPFSAKSRFARRGTPAGNAPFLILSGPPIGWYPDVSTSGWSDNSQGSRLPPHQH